MPPESEILPSLDDDENFSDDLDDDEDLDDQDEMVADEPLETLEEEDDDDDYESDEDSPALDSDFINDGMSAFVVDVIYHLSNYIYTWFFSFCSSIVCHEYINPGHSN